MSVRQPNLVKVKDPGTGGGITVPHGGDLYCDMTTGGSGETRTIGAPAYLGQTATLMLSTDGGGDAVVTASAAINTAGNNTLTFADAGDYIRLFGANQGSGLVWRVVVNTGVALSTV